MMRYTLSALALVSATLALPADLSSQKAAAVAQKTNVETNYDMSPYKRDNEDVQEATIGGQFLDPDWAITALKRDSQDAQKATVKDFEGPFGPGLPNGVAFKRELTGTEPSVKRDSQGAQKATVKDFEGPFGPGLPNGVAFKRELTGTEPSVKRDNQDAQETTAKDFEGPFGPGLPNGVAF